MNDGSITVKSLLTEHYLSKHLSLDSSKSSPQPCIYGCGDKQPWLSKRYCLVPASWDNQGCTSRTYSWMNIAHESSSCMLWECIKTAHTRMYESSIHSCYNVSHRFSPKKHTFIYHCLKLPANHKQAGTTCTCTYTSLPIAFYTDPEAWISFKYKFYI